MKIKEEHLKYLRNIESAMTVFRQISDQAKQVYFLTEIRTSLGLDKDKEYEIDLKTGEVSERK